MGIKRCPVKEIEASASLATMIRQLVAATGAELFIPQRAVEQRSSMIRSLATNTVRSEEPLRVVSSRYLREVSLNSDLW